jgi:hypothetical protein
VTEANAAATSHRINGIASALHAQPGEHAPSLSTAAAPIRTLHRRRNATRGGQSERPHIPANIAEEITPLSDESHSLSYGNSTCGGT